MYNQSSFSSDIMMSRIKNIMQNLFKEI